MTVSVTNNQTGAVQSFVTDGNGVYSARELSPGRYTVAFELQGFARVQQPDVTVQLGRDFMVDAQMRVGALTETVQVSGAAPVVTILLPEIPNILTGSIFIEAAFRIPGLGRFFVTSTQSRDYPMILALVLLIAVLWGITYIITDVLYTILDPRIRLGGRSAV